MLRNVDLETQSPEAYVPLAGREAVEELIRLGAELRGCSVLHLSATPYGGGVSELLRSVVPLERGLGIDARWQVITGDDRFFRVTKGLHDALQGTPIDLTAGAQETYLANAARNARMLEGAFDVVVVHDPQPLALPAHLEDRSGRWVWRCHLDTSHPDPTAVRFLEPFLEPYDAVVFTLPGFVPAPWRSLPRAHVLPAIDPLSPKNMELPDEVVRAIVRWFGVDPDRPVLTQVSRFDPWKDQPGVIEVFRRVREHVPGLQLALLGSMALDDPEGWDLYEEVRRAAGGDPEILVGTNMTGVGNLEVNAFQRCSTVVIQKSIREGFGLVVSEALWKGTPVVAARAGGIPVQMPAGVGGILVEDPDGSAPQGPEGYAEAVLRLLRDPDLATELGERGRRHVRDRFLVTRLVTDELSLVSLLLSGERPGAPSGAT